MWHSLRLYILKASQAGISSEISDGLVRRIRATNAFSLILSAVTFPYSFIFYLLDVRLLFCFAVDIVALSYLLVLFLNMKKCFYLARLFLLILLNTAIFFYCMVFGTESGLQVFFLCIAILPITIFERADRACMVGGFFTALTLYFATIYIDKAVGLPIPLIYVPHMALLLVPTIFFATACLIYSLQMTHDKADRNLRDALALLRTESARLHQILDAMTDVVILSDSHSQPLWGNKAFRNFLGVSLDETEKMFDGPSETFAFAQKQSLYDQKVIQTREPYHFDIDVLRRPDGSHCWFQVVKSPVLDLDGEVSMIVSVCRDITQQHLIEGLIAEQRAQMVATAKLSALGEMAAGIAHEINNPLAIIIGRTLTLKRLLETDPGNAATLRKFARDIEETAFRIVKIINALRSFARSGDQDPFIFSSIGAILDDTLPFCAARFATAGVDLIVDDKLHDCTLECRPTQISQVLLNLLNNAFDSVKDRAEKWVKLSAKKVGDFLEIAVTDSGPGISPEFQSRIFEPFFTTKAIGKGTGLGLSISRGLIEGHGGKIELDTSSKTTRFRILLPTRHEQAVRSS